MSGGSDPCGARPVRRIIYDSFGTQAKRLLCEDCYAAYKRTVWSTRITSDTKLSLRRKPFGLDP